jgi:GNAT superfamily N-acetyltransferase
MSSITIRFATRLDAGLVADISRQTFYDSFAADNSPENMNKFMNEQFSRERLMDEVEAPGNIFLLAYSDDVLAGYARLLDGKAPASLANTEAIELSRIYSLQPMIGKGVGPALMQRCIEIATALEKKVLWLGVWEKNERAIRFYEKFGFEKFDHHQFLLGDDLQTDWLMKRNLQASDYSFDYNVS